MVEGQETCNFADLSATPLRPVLQPLPKLMAFGRFGVILTLGIPKSTSQATLVLPGMVGRAGMSVPAVCPPDVPLSEIIVHASQSNHFDYSANHSDGPRSSLATRMLYRGLAITAGHNLAGTG
jgi:hypothetical protein